jgi:predicted nucleotide-binding protein
MEAKASESTTAQPRDRRNVFVVHGRNEAARRAMFDFLRSLDLQPLEWLQAVQLTGQPSPYVGQILDAAFRHAAAIVVLMTPDDVAALRPEFQSPHDPPHEIQLTPQARPNVLFEAGMAMGRSEEGTVLVELGTLRPFSDIGGRHVIRMNDGTAKRQELAQRLRLAGCAVNTDGIDWHHAGRFDAALPSPVPRPDRNQLTARPTTAPEDRDMAILRVVKAHSDSFATYITPDEVAQKTGLTVQEATDRLIALDGEGFLQNANSHDGYAYRISPSGRGRVVRANS